jgi:alpha-L-rhamnosidase
LQTVDGPAVLVPQELDAFRFGCIRAALYVVGLGMGLFGAKNTSAAIRNLAAVSRENMDDQGKLRPRYSLMTGFIGTAWISKALSDTGHSEPAYRLLLNEQ